MAAFSNLDQTCLPDSICVSPQPSMFTRQWSHGWNTRDSCLVLFGHIFHLQVFNFFFIVFSFLYQRQFPAGVINRNCESIQCQRYDKLCILLKHKECVFVGCNQLASFITSAQFGRWKVTHDNMCHLKHNLWHTTEFIIAMCFTFVCDVISNSNQNNSSLVRNGEQYHMHRIQAWKYHIPKLINPNFV